MQRGAGEFLLGIAFRVAFFALFRNDWGSRTTAPGCGLRGPLQNDFGLALLTARKSRGIV